MKITEENPLQGIPGMDPNIIETKTHTLIIEDKPDAMEPIGAEDENGNPLEIYERIPGARIYKLYIGSFDAIESTENFKLFHKLSQANPDDILEINISSNGGYLHELQEFYNHIVPYFKNVITYLHYGYSAGSMMFLLGTERVVYEHSDFMSHSYSTGVGGKRDDMLRLVFHNDKKIIKLFEKIYSPYFTKKELKKIHKGEDFWMDADEMLKRGIATGIILDSGEYKTREEYLGIKEPKNEKIDYFEGLDMMYKPKNKPKKKKAKK